MKDLKQLYSIKSQTERELSVINTQLLQLNKEKKSKQEYLKLIQNDINKTLTTDIIVSEHAILRYFERVLNYNIEDIKDKILPKDIEVKIKELGDCEYSMKDFTLIIKNNKVVTVETEDDRREK
jgi:hypothetical protein